MVNVCVLSQDMDMDGHMDIMDTDTVTDTPMVAFTITAKGLLIMDMEAIMDGVNNTDVLTYIIMSKKYLLFYALFASCTNKGSSELFLTK